MSTTKIFPNLQGGTRQRGGLDSVEYGNAEFIKDYIPLKTKPEQEDGEKFNDTIQEIAISFNNEQELLVPKIK